MAATGPRADDGGMSEPLEPAWDRQGVSLDPGEGSGRLPDRGSRLSALVSWWVIVPLLLGVVVLQQLAVYAPVEEEASEAPVSPPAAEFEYFGRVAVKMSLGVPGGESYGAMFLPQLEGAAYSEADALRVAMLEAELAGEEAALRRIARLEERWPGLLDELEDKVVQYEDEAGGRELLDRSGSAELKQRRERVERSIEEIHALREDAALLRSWYQDGVLDEESRARLIEHHGWFGRLASTHGAGASDPERARLTSGGVGLLVLMLLVMLAGVVIGVAGLACFVAVMVQASTGRIRRAFRPPAPGGSVYLEVVAVFLASFIVLQAAGGMLDLAIGRENALLFALIAQWALVPVVLWPMLRGAQWGELCRDMGWHAPRGVWREIGAGVFGYLAGLPLFVASVVVTIVIVFVQDLLRQIMSGGEAPSAPPSNPIIEEVAGGNGVTLLLLFVLATVWAPIVEESIMRGALYRHLRSRLHWLLVAPLTALFFGLMHGYAIFLLLPVITLGFNFALIREWRGSIIGCMVAHALHNGAVLGLVITVIALIQE